jgi:outer membrane protein OmpA-like peptidoglycan-associated protein
MSKDEQMNTIKVSGFESWTRLAPLLVVVGCASVAPPDLVSARAAYTRAEASPNGMAAPVELHKAKVALDEAERAFTASAQSETTRDLAYVAERKSETAEAVGSTALADAQKLAAEAAYDKKQAQLFEGAKNDLGKTKEQLAESSRTQQKMATDLNTERGARAEADSKAAAAEQKAAAANEALAKLAAKEEQRGSVITLSGSVLFRTNQAALLPGAQTRLDDVATALMSAKERTVVVEGHTDSRGKPDANLALSQRRAEAVRSYLVSRGYPAEKIEARGIGQERPIAENASAEGRANNRRVEIVVQRASHSSLP